MAADSTKYVVGNATVLIGSDLGGVIAGGITITPTFTTYSPDIEQELYESRFYFLKKKFTCKFALAEPTLENLKLAWDLSGAIGAGPPRVLSFGQAVAANEGDFVPSDRVLVVTSYTPQAVLATRTVTFNKAYLETPGATVFSKTAITALDCTFNCAYDSSSTKVGVISDALT